MEYEDFLKTKRITHVESGFETTFPINPILFDFQIDIVRWSLMKGKSAIFTGTGTGKTLIQLEWANHVHQYTQKPILILAPLAVSQQTVKEGEKLGLSINLCRTQSQVKNDINITNYEMLHNFDTSKFIGIVLDESSILKSFEGKVRTEIIERFQQTPYKLACTATPSPNDYMELGNHAEFVGAMSRTEMLSMFFVHDGGETSKWRIKGHAIQDFWNWVASWSVMLSHPEDLGYLTQGFDLPPLNIYEIVADKSGNMVHEARTLSERRRVKVESLPARIKKASEIANSFNGDSVLIWCNLNIESEMLKQGIMGSKEIKGSDDSEYKTNTMISFSNQTLKKLITKPSIAGFGLNWQHCNKVIFVGLSDSFEQYYQAVRRCWRFGQKNPVDVYIITSEKEEAIVENIKRKEQDFENMLKEMIVCTQELTKKNLSQAHKEKDIYNPKIEMILPSWLK